MITLKPSLPYILFMTEFVLGNFANVFIVLVNCIDYIKKQKISLVDQMFTGLALSRIALLWVILISWFTIWLDKTAYNLEADTVVYIVWAISSHCSIWLATSLSVFYLLKIASISSLLFAYFKNRVNRTVPLILLGSFPSLVFHLVVANTSHKVWMNEYNGNMTWENIRKDIVYFSSILALIIANFIPFAMSFISFVLLLFSLWKHLKKMQLNDKGCQDHSTKVHIRAMQTVISFLLLLVSYFVALIIMFLGTAVLSNGPIISYCQTLLGLYPSGHSIILIWGNKKMNLAFLAFLRQLKFLLKVGRCVCSRRK
nr:unnamed protein product [Sorex araneus]